MFEVVETKKTMDVTEEDIVKMSYGDYIDYLYSTGGFEVPAAPIIENLKDYLAHIFEYMPQYSAEHQMALNFIGTKMRAARKNEYIAAYPREVLDEFIKCSTPESKSIWTTLSVDQIEWVERADVEYREDWVQLIASVLPKIVDKSSDYDGAYLMFLEENPADVMVGETSFIGGHVRYQYSNLCAVGPRQMLTSNAIRELYEELIGLDGVTREMFSSNITTVFNNNAEYGNISRYHIGHIHPIALKYSNVADVVAEPGKKLVMYIDWEDLSGTLPKVGHFEKTKNIPIYYRNTIKEINPDVWVSEYFKLKG